MSRVAWAIALCPVLVAEAATASVAAASGEGSASPSEFLYEMRVAIGDRRRLRSITAGPVLGPMFLLDERNAVGLTVAADLWLVEDGGGISLSPGLRYRHRLTRDLDWSVGAGPVWFPETGSFSASFRRAETSVTIGRAVVVGLRAEQVRGSRPLYSTVVGASGEHGGVLTALAVIGLLLLAASS